MEIDLSYWIKNDSIEKITEILENGADVHHDNEKPLRIASNLGYTDVVELLISYGADIHYNNDYCLFEAVIQSHIDLTKFLLKSGADIRNLRAHLEHIVEVCNPDFIQYLIHSGLEVNNSMLSYAAELDNIDVFKLLLRNLPDANFSDAWQAAYLSNSTLVMDYILDLHIELEYFDRELVRILISNAHIKLIRKILNRISDQSKFFLPESLIWACNSRNYDMIKLVLEFIQIADDDKNNSCSSYSKPLEIATCTNDCKIIKLLLDHGAEVTNRCLNNVITHNNYEAFQLIYSQKKWDSKLMIDALTEGIYCDVNKEIWKILIDEIGFTMDPKSLQKIVKIGIKYSEWELIEYLIQYYGVDTICNLLKKCKLNKEIENIISEKYGISL